MDGRGPRGGLLSRARAWGGEGCEGGSGSQGSRTVLGNRGPLSVGSEKGVIPRALAVRPSLHMQRPEQDHAEWGPQAGIESQF